MEIKTRVPGTVEKLNVKVGDQVKMKDELLTLEAMKMMQKIISPVEGEVTEVNVEEGDRVRAGAILMVIE